MIFGRIENYQHNKGLSPLLKRAFDYIRATDMSILAAGHYAIDGNNLYAIISESATKPEAEGTWEAHRRYIDLHYIIMGTERMGFAPVSRLKPGVYDHNKDFLLLQGKGDFLTAYEGDFIVLWPEDAHMPGIAVTGPSPVKKAVFKIRVS